MSQPVGSAIDDPAHDQTRSFSRPYDADMSYESSSFEGALREFLLSGLEYYHV
jgi:hypothetical protein